MCTGRTENLSTQDTEVLKGISAGFLVLSQAYETNGLLAVRWPAVHRNFHHIISLMLTETEA